MTTKLSLASTVKLNSGYELPRLGLGVSDSQLNPRSSC